jgi:hypothetical protein
MQSWGVGAAQFKIPAGNCVIALGIYIVPSFQGAQQDFTDLSFTHLSCCRWVKGEGRERKG